METLRTIRLQLSAVEDAYRDRRLRDAIDTLATVHDLLDVLSSAFISEQSRKARNQLNQLAELDLVVVDLEERLTEAQSEVRLSKAAQTIEDVWRDIEALLAPAGKILLRTNIFPRGKKTFLSFRPKDTLAELANVVRKRYAKQIKRHLEARGDSVAVPEAVDILFYGSKVWDDPDEAMFPSYAKVADLAEKEKEGVIWFPVLPGDSPVLFREDDEDTDEGFMNLLENFTIEADINHLETEIERVASELQPGPTPSSSDWKSRAYLVRGEGTDREERIPLVGDRVSLGRGRENDIQILNDIKVSRLHCKVIREENDYYLEDNSSSNGTVVNGEIVSRHKLEGGEQLQIGNTMFRFMRD